MRYIKIGLAGKTIGIHAKFYRITKMCQGFISDGTPDFEISSTDEDYYRVGELFLAQGEIIAPDDFYLEVFTTLAKVLEALIDYDAFMLHGATIALNNSAYVFSAPSGTGKTTHIMKWLERCPDAFVVNGDKPFIKFNDDGTVLACGSPWAGKENMYTNTMVPLKAIVLMERAEDNSIERISFAEAFPKLLEQTYRPEDPDKMRKTLKLMQRLNPAVSFWRFKFNNMKDDCFDVAYNALVGQDQ